MKKFYKTTVVVEIITVDEPYQYADELIESMNDNSPEDNPLSASGRVQSVATLSGRMAAKKILDNGGDPADYGVDDDGNEVKEDEGISYEDLNEEENEEDSDPVF